MVPGLLRPVFCRDHKQRLKKIYSQTFPGLGNRPLAQCPGSPLLVRHHQVKLARQYDQSELPAANATTLASIFSRYSVKFNDTRVCCT